MPDRIATIATAGVAIAAQAVDTLPTSTTTAGFGILTTTSVIGMLIWLITRAENRNKSQEEAWSSRFKDVEEARDKERAEEKRRYDDMFTKRIEQDRITANVLAELNATLKGRPCLLSDREGK